jgi:hypothetical protein
VEKIVRGLFRPRGRWPRARSRQLLHLELRHLADRLEHIKVEPDRWYYWADRLGLMVWQDMPSMRVDFGKSREENIPPPVAVPKGRRHLGDGF